MPEIPKFSPAALVAFVLSPIVLVIAVLAAIVGALWWFGIASPLAIAAGVIVIALAAAIFYGGVYLARRRDERAVDATIAGMTDAIGAQDNTPQARERVAKLRAKWERLFKNVRPEYIKSKPILMIMGESKSGKSVLLDKSGLELESGNRQERDWEEGTENVDPWFFPDGLVLDTAGEMLVTAAGGARIDWSELVKLIKTLRPRNPVSGVILAVPVWRLQSDDEAERIKQANLIQREFQRLVQMFGVRFPVSVVVTMADLVDGYSEFALRQSAARPGDKYTILGWPQYQLSDEFGGRDVMAESVSGVTSRIDAQVLYDTCNPETAAVEGVEALEIWCLPKHIRTIGQRLADYLKLVFKEKQSERVANAPFFRGVFFGSAMQAIRKGEPRRKEPERPRSEPFNIRDLLAIRLFGEAGLVTTSPRAEAAARTRRLVGIVVPLAVAAVSAGTALIAFDLAGRVGGQKDALVAINRSLDERGGTPWIDAAGKAQDAQAADLAAEFAAARKLPTTDLPFWLGWYGGFAERRLQAADSATERAWTKLVAMPLLEAAASERAWSTVGGAYRARELEKIGGKSKAALLNPDLLSLDQGLVAALQAAGAKPDGLKLRGESAKKDATERAATPSLAPLLRAMSGQVPSSVDELLAVGVGWRPPARAAELAADALKLHEKFLEDKLAVAVEPLVLAADTHAAWSNGKVDFGGDGDLTWETVKDNVWDLVAELDESDTSPSSRLDTLASWFDLPEKDAKERIIGLFGDGGRARAFGELGDEKRQLTQRIKDLDTLFEARTADFPGIVDSVVTRAEEVQDAEYEPGSLKGTIELDLAALVERPSTESKTEAPEAAADVDGVADEDGGGEEGGEEVDLGAVRKYAKPAIEHFVEKVASFLRDKVVAAQARSVGQPSSKRDGVLAPLSDFKGVNAASLRANYVNDGEALKDWRNNPEWRKWKKLSDDRFRNAEGNLGKLASEVSKATEGWTVVAKSGFGPAEPATAPFVGAVLQNGAKTVDEIAVEVAQQAARLAGKSDDEIVKAGRSAGEGSRERDQLREALKQLAEASRSGSAGVRAGAARFVADLSPSTQSGGQTDPFTVISNGVKAVASLQSPDERLYWQYFWRDVLMEAARLRDVDQDAADSIVRTTGAGFPLSSSEGADPVSPSAVLKLAGIGTASQPGGATNLKPADRGTARLDELLNHRRPAAQRTTAQADAIKIAALLAGASAAPIPDARALRLTVQATGERDRLPQAGGRPLGVEFGTQLADADNNTWNEKHQLIFAAPGFTDPASGAATGNMELNPQGERQSFVGEWSVNTPPSDGSITLSFGVPTGTKTKDRSPRQQQVLSGGIWAGLRLASQLQPIGNNAQEPTLSDGFLWGALPAVEGTDKLYVYIGLKLEWVLKNGKTQPVDIAAWLREIQKPN